MYIHIHLKEYIIYFCLTHYIYFSVICSFCSILFLRFIHEICIALGNHLLLYSIPLQDFIPLRTFRLFFIYKQCYYKHVRTDLLGHVCKHFSGLHTEEWNGGGIRCVSVLFQHNGIALQSLYTNVCSSQQGLLGPTSLLSLGIRLFITLAHQIFLSSLSSSPSSKCNKCLLRHLRHLWEEDPTQALLPRGAV